MHAPDLEAYARDGFLVLPDFLSVADCDALQARAAELVVGFDPGPVRTVFSSHDQSHAKARYFRESGGDIRFFFEEESRDQPAALALNKIGHALHDLDPVFERISRQPKIAALARTLGFVPVDKVPVFSASLPAARTSSTSSFCWATCRSSDHSPMAIRWPLSRAMGSPNGQSAASPAGRYWLGSSLVEWPSAR